MTGGAVRCMEAEATLQPVPRQLLHEGSSATCTQPLQSKSNQDSGPLRAACGSSSSLAHPMLQGSLWSVSSGRVRGHPVVSEAGGLSLSLSVPEGGGSPGGRAGQAGRQAGP